MKKISKLCILIEVMQMSEGQEEERMRKIAVFFAAGYEEIEALTVVDLCRRAGLTADMVSVGGEREVMGAHGISAVMDKRFEEVIFAEYDMLVLPGGMPGTKNLEAHPGLMEHLDEFAAEEKYLAAICAAPSIFGHRGILKGHRACCYPSFENQLEGAEVTRNPVEVSGNIITSRGMGTAIAFGLAIVRIFKGKETAEQLAESIISG